MPCLDDAKLEQLLRGGLAGEALGEVDAHLDTCADCRARLGRKARRAASAPGATRDERLPLRELDPAPDPYLGRVIADRYAIKRRLGGGGMGTVYEAEHVLIGRRVAVKVLLPQWASQREVVRRFQNEARAAGTLRHPGILEALDMGRTEEGTPYLVLDYLEGRDLEAVMDAEAPLSVARAVDIVRTIGDAVGAAHAAGIIHRDLKPENVFLTDQGQLKVLDFGISKITSSLATGPLTAPGAVMGTPMYMAPEQFEDASKADPRSDIWALGVILYRALTGELPFVADTLPGLLLAIVDGEATPPDARRPDVPAGLAAVVMKALSPRPDDRYTTIEELSAALAPFAATPEASSPEPRPAETSVRLDRRVVTLVLATGVTDRAAAEAAILHHGGRLLDGVDFAALFGETTWHGDESVRAVEAALRLRALAGAVAVATGHWRGDVDPAAVALVDRATQACAAGLAGVAVVAPTTRLAARFDLRPVDAELAEVRGGRAAASMGTELLPLVGRPAERAQIGAALDRALDESRPIVLWATGEPGIGKSRLVAEALGIARSTSPRFDVLVGRGVPRGGRQLGALVDAIEHRAREASRLHGWPRLDPSAPLDERRRAVRQLAVEAVGPDRERELGEFLGELLGVPMPPSSALSAARSSARLMRDRKQLALGAYLGGLAAQRPLLIAIEDLQWVDPESLAWLAQALGRELWDRPALILGTARAEVWAPAPPFDDADATELKLRGLGLAGVRELAEAVLGRPATEDLARRLLERTGGNPLFVEQTLRALADDARGPEAAADAALPLPLDVEAAVQARLDALEPAELDVATRGALLGGPFSEADLVALGAVDPAPSLRALLRRGLLRRRAGPTSDEAMWELRTSVIGEVLVRELDRDLARSLHLRAAAIWRERADREWTAYHFEHAGERASAAAEYLGAALEAARSGDGARTLRCSEQALELGVDDEAELALHLARAEALEHAGRLEEQGVALEEASELATTPDERAAIGIARAVRALRRLGPAQSLERFAGAVEDARRAGAPAVLARALGANATALAMAGRIDEAAGVLGEADLLVLTRAPMLRAELASWRAQLAAAQGDLGARRAAYLAALVLFEEVGDERARAGVCVNLGDVLNRFGAYHDAEATLADALDRCRRLGIRLMEGYALANLGYARTMGGRHVAARADLDAARALADAIGDRHLATWASLYRARLALATGAPEHARDEARILAERAASLGLGAAEVLAMVVEARAALALGDVGGATDAIGRALAGRDALGGLEEDEGELFAVHARVLEAAGQGDAAAAARARGAAWLEATARRIGDPEWRQRFTRDVPAHRDLIASER
ncbi:MAG: protein kinase [Sandaracinaceae bacterium]|nr:protein kinase [Sandaracinaceae bacterium]